MPAPFDTQTGHEQHGRYPEARTVEDFQRNLAAVRARIRAACRRVERDPATVRLLPVSKTKPEASLRLAHVAGWWRALPPNSRHWTACAWPRRWIVVCKPKGVRWRYLCRSIRPAKPASTGCRPRACRPGHFRRPPFARQPLLARRTQHRGVATMNTGMAIRHLDLEAPIRTGQHRHVSASASSRTGFSPCK